MLYIIVFTCLIIGIAYIYSGFTKFQEARKHEEKAIWYKQTELPQGIVLALVGLELWLTNSLIGTPFEAARGILQIVAAVVFGIPAVYLFVLSRRSRSQT